MLTDYSMIFIFGTVFGAILCFSFWYMEMEEKGYAYGIVWTLVMLLVGYLLFILSLNIVGLA